MSSPVEFLHGLARAVAALGLYRDGHPARGRAVDRAYDQLQRLLADRDSLLFTFLADEVICGTEPLRELGAWDWGIRLAACGMQRIEFDADATRDDFEALLEQLTARLSLTAAGSAEQRHTGSSRIRFGGVGLLDAPADHTAPPAPVTGWQSFPLQQEADTLRWLHDEVQDAQQLHLAEAEAVVRSLAVAIRGEDMLIPLLRLKNFDEYTTTHAINVAVLSMALTEHLGLGPRDVRTFGVAGLLHDIGKVSIPREILVKPGKLTDAERAVMNGHTVEGARIIIRHNAQLDLAAVVAYEHHIMIDGGGYPALRFRRDCHYASRIVHVCDVYDALRTKRPYRDAWDAERVLSYLDDRAGSEFDPIIAREFIRMMRALEGRVARVAEDGAILGGELGAAAG
jgi:putative nucleotidyltransferase with HDIG domain